MRIKGAEYRLGLDSSDKLTFLVHLLIKAVRGILPPLIETKSKDRRTMRRSKAEEMISFSLSNMRNGYFQLDAQEPLPQGQYGFFFQARRRDRLTLSYSFHNEVVSSFLDVVENRSAPVNPRSVRSGAMSSVHGTND